MMMLDYETVRGTDIDEMLEEALNEIKEHLTYTNRTLVSHSTSVVVTADSQFPGRSGPELLLTITYQHDGEDDETN